MATLPISIVIMVIFKDRVAQNPLRPFAKKKTIGRGLAKKISIFYF
jgi:hypothetical protein